MKAIVDCNSFYCSCERAFRPDLQDKPVVVLSNNDGCVISISDEAKRLGVTMATPYFQFAELFKEHGVVTFSSNYNLYGDMSWRVMETLRTLVGKDNVEVYSVDECFIDISDFARTDLEDFALHLRETTEQWTGIAVSIGVAPTKVLAKVANRLCKKDKKTSNCVMVIDTPEKISDALINTKVHDIWGVGRQFAKKLFDFGIDNAYQLSQMPEEWMRKNMGGVVGVRISKELRGKIAMNLEEQLTEKKMIATTRMFGQAVTSLAPLKEAVATYISRSAEKLRRQNSAAGVLNVFTVYKDKTFTGGAHFSHGTTDSRTIVLPHAVANTDELIKHAMELVEQIFIPGRLYKKAGVVLSGLVPDASIQGNLFVPSGQNNKRSLMNVIDNINFSMRNDILKFAASGTTRKWKMRQEMRSPRYTTRWSELKEIS